MGAYKGSRVGYIPIAKRFIEFEFIVKHFGKVRHPFDSELIHGLASSRERKRG